VGSGGKESGGVPHFRPHNNIAHEFATITHTTHTHTHTHTRILVKAEHASVYKVACVSLHSVSDRVAWQMCYTDSSAADATTLCSKHILPAVAVQT
jgi:hypothetical protein